MDDTVYAVISAVAGDKTLAVIHGFHQINHEMFKESRRLPQNSGQKIVGKLVIDERIHPFKGLLRSFRGICVG